MNNTSTNTKLANPGIFSSVSGKVGALENFT